MSEYSLVIHERGVIDAEDGTDDKLFVRAVIEMTIPFVPFNGLYIIPPSPALDGDGNETYEIKDLTWDCDYQEFQLQVRFNDPRDLGHELPEDNYTLAEHVNYRRANGWQVDVARWKDGNPSHETEEQSNATT